MIDLSILIPSRNEIFLKRTIDDLIQHSESNYEIIAVLDGQWAEPPIPQHERVTLLYYPESIGQRACCNRAAAIARGKYVAKVDAHCAFAQGWDKILLEDIRPDMTIVPVMRNLHAFDWVCPNGHRRYQSPSGVCVQCGEPTKMDIVWIGKRSPQSTSYCFDSEPHFQYFGEFKKRPAGQGNLTETMSLQGSFFMLSRDKYFELNICDESFGSWGSQGIETAVKTWLSGGRVMVDHRTWYAHMFRTQGGDFGFPYPISGNQVEHAKKTARDMFFNNRWPKQTRSLSWLLKKFWPVPGWTDEQLKELDRLAKEVVYYTCNTHQPEIDEYCRQQLSYSGLPIVCVSLNKPLEFGTTRITMHGERGAVMMHRQILEGLENSTAKYIYLCESDVLYHPSHFYFTPKRNDVFYYNTNVWRMRYTDGHFVWTDNLQQVSGCCASRELLLDFYTKRLKQIESDGFNGHYEPGVKQTVYPYVKGGKYGTENYKSEFPNVCIRHDANLTRSKWSPADFRNSEYARGWQEADEIPSWGKGIALVERIRR